MPTLNVTEPVKMLNLVFSEYASIAPVVESRVARFSKPKYGRFFTIAAMPASLPVVTVVQSNIKPLFTVFSVHWFPSNSPNPNLPNPNSMNLTLNPTLTLTLLTLILT